MKRALLSLSTDVSEAELTALRGGDTAFAFDLFRGAAAADENLILSPYSVSAALTMAYAGARGTTATEMQTALHLELSDDRLHAARNELDLRITTPPPPVQGDEREPFAIEVANSLWGQEGYPFREDFLALLAENYDAGMNLVDFATAAEEARREINARVEEQTEGRIVDLIPAEAVDSLTRLVLVNAIWFKTNWMLEFDPERTANGPFTTLAGEELGIVAAFKDPALPGGADFTDITERRELSISSVVHQAFIKVDESGTEAAAATAVIMGATSAPPPAELAVDRPFLYVIEHGSTGEILFLGQLLDPR